MRQAPSGSHACTAIYNGRCWHAGRGGAWHMPGAAAGGCDAQECDSCVVHRLVIGSMLVVQGVPPLTSPLSYCSSARSTYDASVVLIW